MRGVKQLPTNVSSGQQKGGFPGNSVVNNPPANMGWRQIRSLGRKDPLEEEMATHSSVLAWRIPWTEEPGDGSAPLEIDVGIAADADLLGHLSLG